MNPEVKKIGNKLFDKVELSSVKVELAFDFSTIIKQTDEALKGTSSATDKLNKAAASYIEAKKLFDRYQNVPSTYQKNVDAYYKEYNKKAQELGIDTKTTQFYQEYLTVVSKIGQISDNVGQMKSTIASVK
jgi:hypothetical protein